MALFSDGRVWQGDPERVTDPVLELTDQPTPDTQVNVLVHPGSD